jgi:hypothetical protein
MTFSTVLFGQLVGIIYVLALRLCHKVELTRSRGDFTLFGGEESE